MMYIVGSFPGNWSLWNKQTMDMENLKLLCTVSNHHAMLLIAFPDCFPPRSLVYQTYNHTSEI